MQTARAPLCTKQRPRNVVNSDEQREQLSESLLRRILRELVSAVEWMHARFVVYRDIKLESTHSPDSQPLRIPALEEIPLVKLTDFGLSRKIGPDDPWFSTHCSSDSYTAPELLVAAHSTSTDASSPLSSLRSLPRARTLGSRGCRARVHGEWNWHATPVGEKAQARGAQLVWLAPVRDVVGRLLVCDPRRRARVGALWEELWMRYGEAVVP
ncbi:hypothetical protein H4582DRAFT_2130173 [Lactarius indigo]|nr:hypothetical protein H4582DRAFT_2130173 [Lactarius indigo]